MVINKLVKKLFGNQQNEFTVFSKHQHNLSAKSISKSARKVNAILQENGYSSFIVGGAVRDLLLGLKPKDFDIATNARPHEIKKCFRRAYIIGRRFKIVHVHLGRDVFEISTFRASSDFTITDSFGKIVKDNVYGTQLEDATRRDFTSNALYLNPTSMELYDAHHGVEDIKHQALKSIGRPSQRFREDPVRMLRLLRFYAKSGFIIGRLEKSSIKKLKHLLQSIPAARMAVEFNKFLLGGYASKGITVLLEWDLLNLFLDITIEKQKYNQLTLPTITNNVLRQTDNRLKNGEKVSLPFILSGILWPNVISNFQSIKSQGLPHRIAYQDAVYETTNQQIKKTFLTKAICNEIRDIWRLQQSMLFPSPTAKKIYAISNMRRFRAAIRFLELRAVALNCRSNKIGNGNGNGNGNRIDNEEILKKIPNKIVEFINETRGSLTGCGYWAIWWREFNRGDESRKKDLIKSWQRQHKIIRQKNTTKKGIKKKS